MRMLSYLRETIAGIPSLLRPTFLRSGQTYTWSDLRADSIAGFTVAMIQIPQPMALALIAGLPAVYGLYASLFGFIASLWGSSRQLSTGPVAIVSFLTLTSLIPLASPGSPEYLGLAATLAFLVGIIYLLIGIFRLGFIFQLVPPSVVFGFSSAAAVIIIITQIPPLLGIGLPQHDLAFETVANILRMLPSLSLPTFAVGVCATVFLLFSRRLPDVFPAGLIVLCGAGLVSYVFSIGSHGVALVDALPQSLPSFAFPWFEAGTFVVLIPKAALIALVGFVGAHASEKIAARRTREHLDTDHELTGQGLANIVTSFFRGFPLGGSFTLTSLNVAAGGRTEIYAVVTAPMTVLAPLYFPPPFSHL